MATRYLVSCVQYIQREPSKVLPVGSVSGPDKPWTLMGIGPTGEIVYENPNAYPRAYVAKRAIRGNEPMAMAALSSRFGDLRERSVVEDPSSPNGPEIPGSEKSFAHVVKDLDER